MHYLLVEHIKRKGFPTSSKKYPSAHRKASECEKNKYGAKKYKELNRIISKLIPAHELAGTHLKKGKELISKRIPKKYRAEIDYHERIEAKFMR